MRLYSTDINREMAEYSLNKIRGDLEETKLKFLTYRMVMKISTEAISHIRVLEELEDMKQHY